MIRLFCCFRLVILSVVLTTVSFGAFSELVAEEETQPQRLQLLLGGLEVLEVEGLQRVAVANPEIADVNVLSDTEILLMPKSAGVTTLIVWERRRRPISYTLEVLTKDMTVVATRIRELLSSLGIVGVNTEIEADKVLLLGEVDSPEELERLKEAIKPFPEYKNIINLVRVRAEERRPLVEVTMEVLEVSKSDLENLGIEWSDWIIVREQPQFPTAAGGKLLSELFRFTTWDRGEDADGEPVGLSATLNFLLDEKAARTLARPTLVTLSDKEASFNVGGRVPIPQMSTTTGGVTEISIQYVDYGIILKVKPKVVEKDKIHTTLKTEVSDIDWTNAVTISGYNIPAFTTREAETELYLGDGASLLIAGLIKQEESEDVDKIPGLSNIPILGKLFTSREFKEGESEVIFRITPRIIEKVEKEVGIPSKVAAAPPEEPIAPEEIELEMKPPEELAPPEEVVLEELPEEEEYPLYLESLIEYTRYLQQKIAQGLIYPELAKQAGLEGTVKASLHLSSSGGLQDVVILESSGSPVLDGAAIETIRSQAPFLPFPAPIQRPDLWVDLPISYQLEMPTE